ncbi:hypothetical protein NKR19_g6589 [Coniochaeta hoffmannii]|uniref:Uncharacterized protein n=1 Tax=Coniochaeta hoffmannii TaxID=91930 RepID=A0AA38VSS6_9PEZI|nr:hypothetical protein NKR19_g6589 [Coniochaeta hoffmannii]
MSASRPAEDPEKEKHIAAGGTGSEHSGRASNHVSEQPGTSKMRQCPGSSNDDSDDSEDPDDGGGVRLVPQPQVAGIDHGEEDDSDDSEDSDNGGGVSLTPQPQVASIEHGEEEAAALVETSHTTDLETAPQKKDDVQAGQNACRTPLQQEGDDKDARRASDGVPPEEKHDDDIIGSTPLTGAAYATVDAPPAVDASLTVDAPPTGDTEQEQSGKSASADPAKKTEEVEIEWDLTPDPPEKLTGSDAATKEKPPITRTADITNDGKPVEYSPSTPQTSPSDDEDLARLSEQLLCDLKIIYQDWEYLGKIVRRYEAELRERWLADKALNAENKRQELLRCVCPDMPEQYIAGFPYKAGVMVDDRFRRAYQPENKSYMGSMMNQEDLARRANALMLLINSRGRNHPSAHVMTDLQSAKDGIDIGWLRQKDWRPHSQRCLCTVAVSSQQNYRRPYFWDRTHPGDYMKASWSLVAREHLGPRDAAAMFQVQTRLYRFLVDIAREILGLTAEELKASLDSLMPDAPEPPPVPSEQEEYDWSSLPVRVSEGIYRVPEGTPDLDYLQSIVGSKHREAQNHLWALRDDPNYFQATRSQCEEHTKHKLHERHLTAKERFHTAQSSVANAITEAMVDMEFWASLDKRIATLRRVKRRYPSVSHSFSLSSAPPLEYTNAFGILYHHLLLQFAKRAVWMDEHMPPSPECRRYFDLVTVEEVENGRKVPVERMIPRSKVNPNILRALAVLGAYRDYTAPDGDYERDVEEKLLWQGPAAQAVRDELDHVYAAQPEIFSSRIAREISSLTVLSECIRQLDA